MCRSSVGKWFARSRGIAFVIPAICFLFVAVLLTVSTILVFGKKWWCYFGSVISGNVIFCRFHLSRFIINPNVSGTFKTTKAQLNNAGLR